MLKKKKICNGCQKLTLIYKNIDGEKYCKFCSNKKTQLKGLIVKPQKNDEYSKLRAIYLDAHSFCEASLPGICSLTAIEIHHTYSGSSRSKHFLDVDTWKAICRNCHSYIHDKMSAEDARELGLKK